MDVDLIKLVNKLQDTFSHLGARQNSVVDHLFAQLDLSCVEQQRRRTRHASAGCGENPIGDTATTLHPHLHFFPFLRTGR
jgi:hypothetical protein